MNPFGKSAGYSGTPLARKLGIDEGDRVAALHAPKHFPDLLELPAHTILEGSPSVPSTTEDGFLRDEEDAFDVVILFAPDRQALERRFDHAHRLLAWDGGLWVCWPKQSSRLARDLKESDVRGAGLAAGLVDNKVCAVDDDWSGLRFVYRLDDRPARRPARREGEP